jgi:phage shock protein C
MAIEKHLTRSKSNRMLGGVCGGLGEYFGIDPTLIRIIFVGIFFLGVGFPLIGYILLWIIMPPEAPKTAGQLEEKNVSDGPDSESA